MLAASFRPERRTPQPRGEPWQRETIHRLEKQPATQCYPLKSRKLFPPAPCTNAQASQQDEPQAAH